ncbi:MAG TPA: pyridoxamine 5'-phosphate oxidase family protein [Steroidobacteraceae bacterium]|jgi:general stress protein 26
MPPPLPMRLKMNEPQSADFNTLLRLIREIEIGLLTTLDGEHRFHTRPVQTLRCDDEGVLWFFTDVGSAKAEELRRDVRVSIGYAHLVKGLYAAVEGRARVRRDRRKAAELWNALQRAWYPGGFDDPRLGVLELRIERAEYWTTPGRASYALAAARATLTGEPATVGEDVKLPR